MYHKLFKKRKKKKKQQKPVSNSFYKVSIILTPKVKTPKTNKPHKEREGGRKGGKEGRRNTE